MANQSGTSPDASAPPPRTQSSISLAWNFQRRPILCAGMPLSAIQEIDSVLRDAEMNSDVVSRKPRLGHRSSQYLCGLRDPRP